MAVVNTHIQYLARDERFEKEKPYIANFSVPEGESLTNHIFEATPVAVHDCRHFSPDLDTNGFTFVEHATSLSPEDFDSEQAVLTRYLKELEQLIKQKFPQYTDLVFLDYKVRKRSSMFPTQGLTKFPSAQPLLLAHVDMTAIEAYNRVSRLPADEFDKLRGRSFEVLNVWRLLRGPTTDFPLAVCDYQSVDLANDTIANDNLHVDKTYENLLLRKNSAHRWYYLGDQKPDEILIFRNTSSFDPPLPFSFHVAFPNPNPNETVMRESIEMRIAVFHADDQGK